MKENAENEPFMSWRGSFIATEKKNVFYPLTEKYLVDDFLAYKPRMRNDKVVLEPRDPLGFLMSNFSED
jgi:hypothetical protein